MSVSLVAVQLETVGILFKNLLQVLVLEVVEYAVGEAFKSEVDPPLGDEPKTQHIGEFLLGS